MNVPLCLLIVLLGTFVAGSVDQRGCWTCPPGYAHWYDLGLPQPNDRCACVKTSSTTKAPATTTAPARNCWTCSPGYAHWFDLGLPEPADKCACVKVTNTNPPTPAPTPAGNNCWTCSPGYKHWFDLGLPQPADKCACIKVDNAPSTTKAPTSGPATTTTKAPTTSAPTRYCWTCPPGYAHWFDLGMAQPTDPCACVRTNTPVSTTAAPSATTTTAAPGRNCWTCNPGYKHWFELGLPQPSDPCACIATSSGTTSQPTSGPTSSPSSGGSGSGNVPGVTPGTPLQKFIAAFTPNDQTPGGVSFSPGVAPYAPWNPPPLDVVGKLLDNLLTQTKFRSIMMYFIDVWTLNLVKARGLKVLAIVDLSVGDNSYVIQNAITLSRQFPDTIISLACGNELGHNFGHTPQVTGIINSCISQLKNAGVTQPVGVIDVPMSWCNGQWSCNSQWSVANNVDWVGLNAYPWWDNVFAGGSIGCSPVDTAAQRTLDHYNKIQSLYPNKPVVMTEFGWPAASSGSSILNPNNVITGQQCGVANDGNQRLMLQSTINLFRQKRLPCNAFQSFREDWKGNSNSDINRWWGFCSGQAPYTCYNSPQ